MNTASRANPLRRTADLLVGAGVLTGAAAMIWLNNFSNSGAFLAIFIPALLPTYIWLRKGAAGMPILPIVSVLYILYYAIPIVAGAVNSATDSDILRAGLTVGEFLLAATFCWQLVGFRPLWRKSASKAPSFSIAFQTTLIDASLAMGLAFNLASNAGWLSFTGSFIGVVRAIADSGAAAGFFFVGYAHGRNQLRTEQKIVYYSIIAAIIALQLTSLLLIGPLVLVCAVLLGFVIAVRRLPWVTLALLIAGVSLMQSGKEDMRKAWWGRDQQFRQVAIMDTPFFLLEWMGVGITHVETAPVTTGTGTFVGRANLLNQLLLVQRLSPGTVPYLNGATYGFLPEMLLPRFLVPDKVESRFVLQLLSVRYGLQPVEATATTTISWGIVPEAFANFGYLGVLGAGIAFGLLAGFFSALSNGTALLSLRTLLSVTTLVTLLNVEVDFGYLLSTLFTALVGISIFYAGLKLLQRWSKTNRRHIAKPA